MDGQKEKTLPKTRMPTNECRRNMELESHHLATLIIKSNSGKIFQQDTYWLIAKGKRVNFTIKNPGR